MTPYSAAAGGSFARRSSSRRACAVGLLWEIRLLDLGAQLGHLRLLLVALAELLLDRLQLLAEDELALRLVHLGLDLGLDLRPELEDLELAGENDGEPAEAPLDVGGCQELLLLFGGDSHGRGDEVRERARRLGVRRGELELLGQVRRDRDDAGEERLERAGERLDLALAADDVGERGEAAGEVRLGLLEAVEAYSVEALDEHAQRAVGDADHLVDDRGGTDLVEVFGAPLLLLAGA